jgi:hypothetical protein
MAKMAVLTKNKTIYAPNNHSIAYFNKIATFLAENAVKIVQ